MKKFREKSKSIILGNAPTFLSRRVREISVLAFLLLFFCSLKAQPGSYSYTLSPQPVNGQYAAGTVVTFCFTLNSFGSCGSAETLEGFDFNLGSGWASINPATSPTDCAGPDSPGQGWLWKVTNTTAVGTVGPGYFYEGASGPIDGNPSNDLGDNGNCVRSFCVNLIVAGNVSAGNLALSVSAGSQGYWGNWVGSGCDYANPIVILPSSTTIAALPQCTVTATSSSTNANNCAGATFTLSASAVAGAQSYHWVGPNGYAATGQTVTIPSAQVTNSGTYIVHVAGSSSCSSSTNVIVNPVPQLNLSSNGPVCACEPLLLSSGLTATPGLLIAWTGPNFASLNANPTITCPQASNSVTYTCTALQSGCQNQAILQVVINPKPVLNISDTTLNFCAGQQFPGQALNAQNSSITWFNSNTAIGLPTTGSGNIPPLSFSGVNSFPTSAAITILASNAYCQSDTTILNLVLNQCPNFDGDSDGYTVAQGDCNDNNANIHPGAIEICQNGLDDNCDGVLNNGQLYYRDLDFDGYAGTTTILACSQLSTYYLTSTDCNDSNPAIHPGAIEVLSNNIDENCDGIIPCELAITNHPLDVFSPIGGIANFTITVPSTNSGVSYQWQTLFNGQWINLFNAGQYAGVNTSSLTVNNLNQNNYGKLFRCYLTSSQNAFCPTYSNSATIYGCDYFQQNFEITASKDTVCFGNEVHLEVPALTTCSSGLHGIVLNEVMINAAGACDGSCTPSSGEWVELYNNDIFPVDLGCYIITDGDFSVTLPAGTTIPGNGFLVIGSSNSGVPINVDIATCGCTTGPNAQLGIFTNSAEQVLLFDELGTITDGIVWGGGQWSQQTFFTTNTIGNCSSITVPINPNFPQIQTVPAQSLYDGQSVFRSCDGAGSWAVGAYPPTGGQSNNGMNGDLSTINSFVDDTLHYLSDLNSCQYFNIQVSDMSNASLTNINEIVSVNVNMEHSYLGDLDITLYCPSGQSVILHQNGNPQFSAGYLGVSTFLGVPIDVVGPTDPPGIGWDYSWTPSSTSGTWISNVSTGTVGTLPSGNYNAIEPFSDLLGCPINGIWTIEYCDLWASDDGWLFNWGLDFNNVAVSSYDSISWQGSTLNWSDANGNANFSPNQYGPNEYSVMATLSNGCVLSDTISIEAVGPIISLVPEINTCTLPVILNPSVQGGADYVTWTYFNNPAALSQNNTLNTSVLQQPTINTYQVNVTSYSNGLYCMDSAQVVVNFLDASIFLQPVSVEANLGDIVYFSCTASPGTTYQWQILVNGVWTNLFNAGQFSGVNTSQLSVSNVNLNNVNQQFQCVISSADGGCTETSNIVSINFCDIASSSIPSVLNVSLNSSPNIGITPITNGAAYQWQSNIGFGWMNISDGVNYQGTTTPNLQIINADWQNENEWLQCIVSTNLCSDTTNICVVHITPTGIDETEAGSIYYYENAIHFSKVSTALGQPYYVFDGSGKLISEGLYLGDQTIHLDLVSSGVYCFKLGDRIIKFAKVN